MIHRDIREFIPQREPILMVDELANVGQDMAVTGFTIRADNCFFIEENGILSETGLIEHIAQSASAFAGYRAYAAGSPSIPIGYIGEVKKFHCYRRPGNGEKLHTHITLEAEADGISLISGKVYVDNETIAETQMKISIKQM